MKFRLKEIADYRKESVPVESINDMNYISTENMLPNKLGVTISSGLPKTKSVAKFKKGDILISNIRPYFKKIWLADFDGGASNDVLIIRPLKVESTYLYYLLLSDHFFEYMTATSKGTKMPRGDKKAVMNYELHLLDPHIAQRNIDILKDIDKKVNINDKLISNLENLSETLFKNWFIDFEFPNEEGQPYKSSGGKMVESELGMIPEEWEVKSLTDIANYKNGLAMQKYRPIEGGETLPVLKIKELNEGTTSSKSDLCTSDINEEVKVYDGDVIFSWSGTLMVKLWSGGNAGLNQHLFKVTSTNSPKWLYYLWTSYHLDKFIGIAKDKATTMGHINRRHLEESLIVVPSDLKSNDIFRVFNSLIEQQISLGLENRKLIKLRDTLLPKLLSGEIEVPVKEPESV